MKSSADLRDMKQLGTSNDSKPIGNSAIDEPGATTIANDNIDNDLKSSEIYDNLNVMNSSNSNVQETQDDDEFLAKNSSRTKLNNQDIRLILYLIVTIKPFKYIGDRTLSQTRKWELIQKRFSHLRHVVNPSSTFVPTVRTLQRQLSSAVKKAKQRTANHPINTDNPNPIFKSINEKSSIQELETATLELFELSETLKSGKIANSALLEYSLVSNVDQPDSVAEYFDPTMTHPQISTSTSQVSYDYVNDYKVFDTLCKPNAESINHLNKIRLTINQLLDAAKTTREPARVESITKDIVSLTNELTQITSRLQAETKQKIHQLIDANNSLIQQNRQFDEEQLKINTSIYHEIKNYLRTSSSATDENIKSLIDSL